MPEEINLETFNADPITEDVSDVAPQAAPGTAPQAAPEAATQTQPKNAVETQQDLSAEIKAIGDAYAAALKTGKAPEIQPRLDYSPYRSSILRQIGRAHV